MPKFEAGMESMLDAFMFETGELLENLDEILMRTEQTEDISQIDEDDINEIFRTMHTIKGSSAMMGLQNMSVLAHAVEDLFYIIREKTYVNMDKPAMFELLYKSSDSLKEELANVSDEDIPLTDFTELVNDIHTFADYLKGTGGVTGRSDAPLKLPEGLFRDDDPDEMITYKVIYTEDCQMPSARAMVMLKKLGAFAEVCRTFPEDIDDDNADDYIKNGGLYIKLITDDVRAVEKVLESSLNVEDFKKITADEVQAEESELPQGVFLDNDPAELVVYKVKYSENCAMPSARAMVVIKKLGVISEVCGTVPFDLDEDSSDDAIRQDGLYIRLMTDDAAAAEKILKNAINVEKVRRVKRPSADKSSGAAKKPDEKISEQPEKSDRAKQDGQTENPAAAAENNQAKSAGTKTPSVPRTAKKPEKKEQSMLTVKLEKLDKLLDLVSEIVISESAVISSPDLRGLEGRNLDNFNKSSRELRKLTDELQDVVMSLRMVPVSTAFQKMNRVVRDMNNTLHKNVTLIFKGQETEVDKAIIDILGDPLMHIVRNAVDHGIETPEERLKAGKTHPATVTLTAGYDSNEVVISCKDNGAGMNAEKIMAKAKKNGLLTKPENEYTEKEIFNFVVAAGFSTNEQVTQYSGRGVGMDVVKKNIEKVGGKLTVNSKLGKGSTFTIRIPLSLSIIEVLSIMVGKSNLSIPASAIREAFSCSEENFFRDPEGNEFVYLREKCLPLIRLSEKLMIEGKASQPWEGICLYCRDGQAEGVFMADSIICDQQVVVKPFSPLLEHLNLKESGLAGCSILGDGSITLILDVKTMITGIDDTDSEGGSANG